MGSCCDHEHNYKLHEFNAHQRDIWTIAMFPADESKKPQRDCSKMRIVETASLEDELSCKKETIKMATASQDGSIKLWNLLNECIGILDGGGRGPTFSVAFAPHGKILASSHYDNTIRVWSRVKGPQGPEEDLTKDQRKRRKKLQIQGYWDCRSVFRGHGNAVNTCVFNPDGTLIASASDDNTIRIWTLDGKCRNTIRGHTDSVSCCAFSPDGKTLVSASWDRSVKIWRVLNGKCINTLLGHRNYVWRLDISTDGEYICSCSWDASVRIWSKDGKLLTAIGGHKDRVTSCKFVPQGDLLATSSMDGTCKIWTLTGKCVFTFRCIDAEQRSFERGALCCNWSNDGHHLISGTDKGMLIVWELPIGKVEEEKKEHYDVTAVPALVEEQEKEKEEAAQTAAEREVEDRDKEQGLSKEQQDRDLESKSVGET